MQTKLTLKLDAEAVKSAKKYAHEHNASLSKLVENYFNNLEKKTKKSVSPIVAELAGIISEEQLKNYKDEYTKYLIEKYIS